MNKKIILFLLMMILLAVSVNAITNIVPKDEMNATSTKDQSANLNIRHTHDNVYPLVVSTGWAVDSNGVTDIKQQMGVWNFSEIKTIEMFNMWFPAVPDNLYIINGSVSYTTLADPTGFNNDWLQVPVTGDASTGFKSIDIENITVAGAAGTDSCSISAGRPNQFYDCNSGEVDNVFYNLTFIPTDMTAFRLNVSKTDTGGNFVIGEVDFFEGTPIPPPGATVTIHRPLNDSLIREDPVNITFSFHEFDAVNCSLYANTSDTGDFEIRASIQTGQINTTNLSEFPESLLGYYRFEEGSGNNIIDSSGRQNQTSSSLTYTASKGGNSTGNFSTYYNNGVINDSYINFSLDSSLNPQEFTISAWVFINDTGTARHIFSKFDSTAKLGFVFFKHQSTDKIRVQYGDGITWPVQNLEATVVLSVDTWTHLAWTKNATHDTLFINGVVDIIDTSETIDHATSILAMIGGDIGKGTWLGMIDEFLVFNESLPANLINDIFVSGLNQTETIITVNQTLNQSTNITFLIPVENPEDAKDVLFFVNCFNAVSVNSSIFFTSWDSDFIPPVIDVLFPIIAVNDTFNFNMFINVSIDELGSCSVNNTAFNLDVDNGTFFSFSETTLDNKFYAVNINCSDDSVVLNIANQTIFFTKDKEFPRINTFFPLEDNTSIIENTGSVTLISNLTDNNDLFSVTVNITFIHEFLGETLIFQDNLTISGSNYVYIKNVNTFNWTNITYTEKIRTCDSHTSNQIKDVTSVIKQKDNIKFMFGDTIIHIKSLDKESKNTDYSKQTDRYSFSFEYNKSIAIKEYKIMTDSSIAYIPSSGYKGHFVIDNRYWIDFEQEGDVTVEQICDEDDCFYKVTVENSDNIITFNSIGELNCLVETYTFGLLESAKGLRIAVCPETTAGILLLWLIVSVSIVFIIMGFVMNIGILGIFGSLMMMVSSWYIAPCQNLFAFIIAGFSAILLIWFALSGLGFIARND